MVFKKIFKNFYRSAHQTPGFSGFTYPGTGGSLVGVLFVVVWVTVWAVFVHHLVQVRYA